MRTIGLVMILAGFAMAAMGLADGPHLRESPGMIVAGIFGVVSGIVMLLRTFRKQPDVRGFEVKSTPGMTPGLIEKKEDDHG